MKLTPLATTMIDKGALELLELDEGTTDGDHLAEVAGRACYQSWSRPNPSTASNDDYLANVIALGHESVLAHAGATFYLEGVSRSLTHELIRHRFLAFSELSQRYVDASEFDLVYPPDADDEDRAELYATFVAGVRAYRHAVDRGEARGLTRKRARQAARAHLPLCTETKIVVSGNFRAWRDFLAQRRTEHADLEIAELAELVLAALREVAPATFADFPVQRPW